MPFPESPRVFYEKTPLVEVTCQVRYPKLLRIDKQEPVDFQEHIYDKYPNLLVKETVVLDVNPNEGGVNKNSTPAYEFSNAENNLTATLASEALTLVATQYVSWQQFNEEFLFLLDALRTHYPIKFFTRLGLRYKDIINRADLGLNDAPWQDLLAPSLVGVLAEPHIGGELIKEQMSRFVLELVDPPSCLVHVQHGLVTHKTSQEKCYIIDSDFITDSKVEIEDANDYFTSFNRKSGRLFRWGISKALHEAMLPRDPD